MNVNQAYNGNKHSCNTGKQRSDIMLVRRLVSMFSGGSDFRCQIILSYNREEN